MELFVADLIERFYTALWPFLRIGAMLIAVPVLSIDAVSVRIRVILTLALTLMIYPLVDWPTIDPVSAAGLSEIFNQILIGVLMGFFLQIVTAAVVLAGQAIANSMGLAMATMVDPGIGTVPLMSQFLLILATLIFLGVGGHILMIGILLRSFETFPVGVAFITGANFAALVEWSAMIFLGGMLMALPVLVALLLVNIGVGVMTRAAPSLNIFAVGFPVFFLTGYAVLILSMAGIGARIQWLWMEGIERVKDFVMVPGVL
ncbi:MAG TPA: flagellar biosynthetic protein FliR [Gammaproteobacteria bacterium]|nr:flagellar biosynthetic protein FliR [Gammaproteobacteria bacterium]